MRSGGLCISPSLEEIPRAAMWSYLYGPTIIAVLYSLCWAWIDLDVKRMQPWLELSRPCGAKASESLFLEYPAEFLPFVPGKALKLRYAAVESLSCIEEVVDTCASAYCKQTMARVPLRYGSTAHLLHHHTIVVRFHGNRCGVVKERSSDEEPSSTSARGRARSST